MKRLFRLSYREQTLVGVLGVCLLFAMAFSYAMFQGGFVSWFVFYSSLPILLGAILVLFYPLGDIVVSRIIKKQELFGGETLHVTLEMNRRIPFPLFYLVIQDQVPERMVQNHPSVQTDQVKALFSPGFKRNLTFSYEIKNLPRGDYKLSRIELKTGDFFGLMQKRRQIVEEAPIMVYPKLYPLDEWKPQDLAFGGSHRSKKHFEHDLTSLSSVRDYMPGDRLSWLDWKATARANRLVTKQFEYPLNRDMIVVLDRFVDPETYASSNFETGISLAASLVERGLKYGASVGLISIGKDSTFFELSQQVMSKWRIFNHLVKVGADGQGEASLSLSSHLQKLPHQATLVYVTTQLNEKDLFVFNEISTRGLSIEYFYVNEGSGSSPSQLNQLKSQGIVTHHIRSNKFNQELKAGGNRATS